MKRHVDPAVITQARQSDLHAVMTALGGERHRYDKAKYRLPDGRVPLAHGHALLRPHGGARRSGRHRPGDACPASATSPRL